ncbi:hypothetical protein, partial [Gemmatimonas sp.]|uniref:hypothetical protein n=1 Tax=Gemmatimonas sp. TaxID=1962908 RepID=UPI0025BFFC21
MSRAVGKELKGVPGIALSALDLAFVGEEPRAFRGGFGIGNAHDQGLGSTAGKRYGEQRRHDQGDAAGVAGSEGHQEDRLNDAKRKIPIGIVGFARDTAFRVRLFPP